MKETSIGLIGLTLSVSLWLIYTWQLVVLGRTAANKKKHRAVQDLEFFLSVADGTADASSPRSSPTAHIAPTNDHGYEADDEGQVLVVHYQGIFLVLMWMAAFCQGVAYGDIAHLWQMTGHDNHVMAARFHYILLDVGSRSILELFAVSALTTMWLRATLSRSVAASDPVSDAMPPSPSSPTSVRTSSRINQEKVVSSCILPVLFWFIMVILVSVGVLCCLSLLTLEAVAALPADQTSVYDDTNSTIGIIRPVDFHLMVVKKMMWMIQTQTTVESLAWGLQAILVLCCSAVESRSILKKRLSIENGRRERLCMFTKTVLPMLLSGACYLVRCIWLLLLCLHKPPTWFPQSMEHDGLAWWAGFMWAPTWIIMAMFFWSTHEPQAIEPSFLSLEEGSDILRQPLLSSSMQDDELLAATPRAMTTRNGIMTEGTEMADSETTGPMPYIVASPGSTEVGDEETLTLDPESRFIPIMLPH